jgi:hypothetical protein
MVLFAFWCRADDHPRYGRDIGESIFNAVEIDFSCFSPVNSYDSSVVRDCGLTCLGATRAIEIKVRPASQAGIRADDLLESL